LEARATGGGSFGKNKTIMEKCICIHGHFYQPPRENPWLESIELQDSASPYHDWNERICFECYAPNARARLLDGEGHIERIVSNYSRMSFNFGPTLLMWMKDKTPEVHDAIVDADKKSCERFSGHGSALAQGYNHVIMPLANARDKHTQVLWGIRDFEKRFGRKPEGMWLPETAADDESLDVLAEHGIKFTILSPFQAKRTRPLGPKAEWEDVNGGRIDPSMPYLVKLKSGRSIAVFFYDAPVAQAIAFEKLLANGERLAARLMEAFDDGRDHDQLAHVATDGESYGHHFQYGDMALAYALHAIEANGQVKLTIYAEYLEKHPPAHEVEIHQASAWSCPHGVGRWKENCGCNSGGHGDWNQKWREPLRNALDQLRDRLAPVYESRAKATLKDPWGARDQYINVILDRSPENIAAFFKEHATHPLNETEQITTLRLLEMQRHAMLMYTSCGWFFDEISGLESVQVIQYAARAIQLANDLGNENFEAGFLQILEQAESNLPENANGRRVYEKFVKPAVMTRGNVAAHYAISSLFESYPEETRIYSFVIQQQERQLFTAGNARLAFGRIKVTFAITLVSDISTYAVVHLGDHNLNCGVRLNDDPGAFEQFNREARTAFERADFPELIRLIDRHFGEPHYSLKNLFRDEQRKVLNQILAATRDEIHNTYRLLTDRYAPLTRFLADSHASKLSALAPATEFVLNSELRKQFENGHLDVERIKSLLAEGSTNQINLDTTNLSYAVKLHFDRLSDEFLKAPEDPDLLQRFLDSASLIGVLPFGINLWKAQNAYDRVMTANLAEIEKRADEKSKSWLEKFRALGVHLGFHVERKSNHG
jgi:alpha-amylase/alpha-mannosidase (GH57 family)